MFLYEFFPADILPRSGAIPAANSSPLADQLFTSPQAFQQFLTGLGRWIAGLGALSGQDATAIVGLGCAISGREFGLEATYLRSGPEASAVA